MPKIIGEGLTFDDVLLVPQRSGVASRKDVDTGSPLTPKIRLATPIVSSNMDTVTEAEMAAAMAQQGGLGIIHRFMSIDQQVSQVARVKRLEGLVIKNPYTISPEIPLSEARELMDRYDTSLMVVDKKRRLIGILTHRDLRFETDFKKKVSQAMTKKSKLVTGSPHIEIERAQDLLHRHRIEKLPLVNRQGQLVGLITSKDLIKRIKFPTATKDSQGRLMVGAAIGVKEGFLERAKALIEAEVDVLVVDIAHGHSELAIETVKRVKQRFPKIEVIAGNVATTQGVRDLQAAGADAIKVGVGPGSVCTTRIVAGSGYPQLSAIMECAKAAKVPLIADGGIRFPGDIAKALAVGAQTVMIGNLLAGTDEAPGSVITRDGKRFKLYRGMAGVGANLSRKDAEGQNIEDQLLLDEITAEGVDALVPYRGSVKDVLRPLVGGLRSGMSYSGAQTIKELQQKAQLIRLTPAGITESHAHDVKEL
ncbi:MAG: IMP dehydrogenase [Patescibacteria group bacterium]